MSSEFQRLKEREAEDRCHPADGEELSIAVRFGEVVHSEIRFPKDAPTVWASPPEQDAYDS